MPEKTDAHAREGSQDHAPRRYTVAVFGTTPVTPPLTGGQMHMVGRFHALGPSLPTTLLAPYDRPAERIRRVQVSDTLEEIDVPLSAATFQTVEEWKAMTDVGWVYDIAFAPLALRAPEYLEQLRAVAAADIVVLSLWPYPVVKPELANRSSLVVYDSHNVEAYLHARGYDDGRLGTELVKLAIRTECELCHAADLVIACSHEDRLLFHDLYGVPFHKIVVMPQGVFTQSIRPADEAARRTAREHLQLAEEGAVALFMGSNWEPNREAARFICQTLAPAFPGVTFVILGRVGDEIDTGALRIQRVNNVVVTGGVDTDTMHAYLAASDLALNPVFHGSGSNVKMFDYMAAGLPVVTTPVGARGVAQGAEPAFVVAEPSQFVGALRHLGTDPERMVRLGAAARRLAESRYSWERMSGQLGVLLHRYRSKLGEPVPFFSVVVATYERPDSLRRLFEHLQAQTCRDFEVIIVDQSARPWDGLARFPELDVLYVHTDVKGAVGARNSAALFARGEVLALTDDDCEPFPDWLQNARPYFEDPDLVGIEGLILSEDPGDPALQPITNLNFEGVGFMTANLLLRREAFYKLDGFDERFDHPHFREDSDLGWRAVDLGPVPFGYDVRVFHPPRPYGEGIQFFEKDALLMAKHPERYRMLFLQQAHYLHVPGFREEFLRGVKKYGVDMDPVIARMLDRDER